MNTLHGKMTTLLLGATLGASLSQVRADEIVVQAPDEVLRQELADGDASLLVPPAIPTAPQVYRPTSMYRPVYGRRYYARPPYAYRGWARSYYYPRSYYSPDYGYYDYSGPRYYRYYGGSRVGYYNYPYGGTGRVGPLRFYWR